ncbi:serine protease inhibitor dipetalogastin-like [Mya arenaria]|uniref:serine protease inhibitor dipetalogastin-like n=1 Tax=Mya arenaria TaxID=6604 RepID=UPI0022E427C3|nr:serine protease inhibitor dipetalogastin-like [Mya arenaria]
MYANRTGAAITSEMPRRSRYILLQFVSYSFENCVAVDAESPGCVCNYNWDPVCGADGKTYGNKCALDCAKVALLSTGECPCKCPKNLAPVCGNDGVTYDNACLMKCKGASFASTGPC